MWSKMIKKMNRIINIFDSFTNLFLKNYLGKYYLK